MYVPGRRPGPRAARDLLRDPRPVQRHRRQPDAAAAQQSSRCYPKSAAEETPCAKQVIGDSGAPRLPPSGHRPRHGGPDEILRDRAARSRDFDAGVRRALTAVLAHPDFLFRTEQPAAGAAARHRLRASTICSLASRLSFFLWSSLPDDELLEVAAAGKLHEPEELKRQVTPHARRSALDHAGAQLRLPVAEPDQAAGDHAGSGDLPVRQRRRRPARRFPSRRSRCSSTTSSATTTACWSC